jgi:hypothetical protein
MLVGIGQHAVERAGDDGLVTHVGSRAPIHDARRAGIGGGRG